MRNPRITQHAIERYISRVDPGASRNHARRCIQEILAGGKVRSNPRHWMRDRVVLTPGLRFVYWADMPSVCILVLDGAAMTVLTRSLCKAPRIAVLAGGDESAVDRRPRIAAGRAAQPYGGRVAA